MCSLDLSNARAEREFLVFEHRSENLRLIHKQARRQARSHKQAATSKQGGKQAATSKQGGKQGGKQAGKQAATSKEASKQASKRASKRASKQPWSKQASKQAWAIKHQSLVHPPSVLKKEMLWYIANIGTCKQFFTMDMANESLEHLSEKIYKRKVAPSLTPHYASKKKHIILISRVNY